MNEQTINFQFLRDCIKALQDIRAPDFTMRLYTHESSISARWPCGTPACVLGHKVYWDMARDGEEPNDSGYKRRLCQILAYYHTQGVSQVTGLTGRQHEALFGSAGCGNALTAGQALKYIQKFIVAHGGSLEDPKPLDVCIAPDWEQMIQQPAVEVEHARVSG